MGNLSNKTSEKNPSEKPEWDKSAWKKVRNFFEVVLGPLKGPWNWVRTVVRLLMPFRFSLFTILIVGLLFWSPPGRDLLVSMLNRDVGLDPFWDLITFFVTLLFWCLSIWYWSRVVNDLDEEDFSKSIKQTNGDTKALLENLWPVLKGYLYRFIAFVVVSALIIWLSSKYLRQFIPREYWSYLFIFSVALPIALIYMVFIHRRWDSLTRKHPGKGPLEDAFPLSHWQCIRKYSPRVLGFLPFFILAWVFPLSSDGSLKPPDSPEGIGAWILSAVSLTVGLIYLGIMFKTKERFFNDGEGKKDWGKLSPASVRILTGIIIINTLIFITAWANPQMATWVGTGSVVFLAAISWVTLGSFLMALGRDIKFPIILTAAFLAVAIGPLADNHDVRTSKATPSQLSLPDTDKTWDQRMRVGEDFTHWLTGLPKDPSEPLRPVFFISAEGGGIRAAYWTANMLAGFQKNEPQFSDHVYALSGISGGSLGTALFMQLVKHQKAQNCFDEDSNKKSDAPECQIDAHARDILAKDFLSPTVASMLYPDLVQRFNVLSFLYKFPDRAYALETSFEKAWKDRLKNDQFSQPFLNTWAPLESSKTAPRLPSLFLNSTWVEGGKRIITSNVKITPDQFPDAEDMLSILCADLPLSTAVHNSARFSYISPAGTLREPVIDSQPCRTRMQAAYDREYSTNEETENDKAKGEEMFTFEKIRQHLAEGKVTHRVWGHVVDGGYFENSGNTTTYDILSSLEPFFERTECKPKPETHSANPPSSHETNPLPFLAVVITLINDPQLASKSESNGDHKNSGQADPQHPKPNHWLTESLSPPRTLVQTRDGRGRYAREAIRKYVEQHLCGIYLEFKLNKWQGDVPLSWALSQQVRNNIDSQVKARVGELGNPLNVEGLKKYLEKQKQAVSSSEKAGSSTTEDTENAEKT